ncbi:MAG TPA: cbb3-type cytochrome oxidase assembly protein CcoS [Piscirickettsiaceae bacterium]|nr:cbb3-type cytochrome oxidase assembly protein CcoS [Piscirickettsiaceae bacterium]
MDVIYGLIPFVLLFGFLAVVVFIWMAKKGQFDDLDGAANRILFDDDEEPTMDSMRQREQVRQTQGEKEKTQVNGENEKG